VLLLIKNIKFKEGKLILKFISLFKILKYIKELIYKLKLPSIYNYLYSTFYISFFIEYIAK
jgi:hypothetical protein